MSAMRQTRLPTIFTASALSLVLGAAVLALSAPARAADDAPLDTRIMRSIMEGLGLKKDGEGINYQERAPLVLPNGRTLPPPEKSDAAANNPAWPKDPDVARRKAEIENERKSYTAEDVEREANPLRPDQLTPGGKPHNVAGQNPVTNSATIGDKLSPSELGYKGGLFGNMFGKKDQDVANFTGEPPRASLTEPPPGYQTPSPSQPYGLGKEMTAPKAFDYKIDRGTQNNN